MTALTAVLLAVTAYLTLVPAVRALRGRRRLGLADRAGAVDGVATALLGTVLARQVLPWDVVPAALWVLPVSATVATVLGGAVVWRGLPTFAGPRWRRTAGTAVSVVLALAVLVAAVW